MSRKTNGNAWNKPVYSLNLTSFVLIGSLSYLALGSAGTFTLVVGTQQCV